MLIVEYGIGGHCEDCGPSHEHPLNNIIGQFEVPDPEPTAEELARQSAMNKLKLLGLDEEEIQALLATRVS